MFENWDEDEDIDQFFESKSDTDTMTAFGKPKRVNRAPSNSEGTTLLPKGGESGRDSEEPDAGIYGGAGIPSKGMGVNRRVHASRTGVAIDSRGRNPGGQGG